METKTYHTVQKLYEQDYFLWVEETLKLLEAGKFEGVDWENLLDEVADLGRRERDKLTSLLMRLFEHIQKLGYWESEREYNAAKCRSEITNFRVQIKKVLKNSPSLKPYLLEIFNDCYLDSRKIIIDLTELPPEIFPLEPIASVEEILDEDWFPSF